MSRITVRVHPKASRVRRVWDGNKLELWIHEPPVDGAANNAVIEYMAKWLGVPRRSVAIVSGHTARTKVVEVQGLSDLPQSETLL